MTKTKPPALADYGDEWWGFADSLARIEEHGGVDHLVFALCRNSSDGTPERKVVARVIIPAQMRIRMAKQLISGAGSDANGEATDQTLH
jgi:hypothetical protein